MLNPWTRLFHVYPFVLLIILAVLPGCPEEGRRGTATAFNPIWADVPTEIRFCCVSADPFPQSAGKIEFRLGIDNSGPIRIHIKDAVGPCGFVSDEPGFDYATHGELNPIEIDSTSPFTLEVLVTSCDLPQVAFTIVQQQDEIYPAQGGYPGQVVEHETSTTCVVVTECAPPVPPAGSRILFSSDRYGDWEILSMAPDGADVIQHTVNLAEDLDPVWSPDRSRIAFLSDRHDQPATYHDLYVLDMDPVTGVAQRHTYNALEMIEQLDPAWSPDGTRIAFAYRGLGFGGIQVINPDTSEGWFISYSESGDRSPTWSPDSKQVAFERDGTILLVEADGVDSQTPQILYAGPEYAEHPSWSPDGASIAFVSASSGTQGVHVLDRFEGGTTRLSTDWSDDAPAWSPDSAWVTYTRLYGDIAVLTMRADGQSSQVVPDQVSDSRDPDWR